jgi:hypothetical protein
MTLLEVKVSCPVYDSFRVRQVCGMFDVPITGRAEERFCVDVPAWLSGSKTNLALAKTTKAKPEKCIGNAARSGAT